VRPLPAEAPQAGELELLDELLELTVDAATPPVLAAAETGPVDPSATQGLDQLERLCDPAPLVAENFWSRMPDLSVRIGAETLFPDVTGEMIDWWFDWHSRRPDRYRVWHPVAHFSNAAAPAVTPGAKPFWGAVNFPREDVGDGPANIRIRFQSPREFGFAGDHLDDPAVATIICGRAGDSVLEHTFMAHVFLREERGLRLRSRFWIAEKIRPRLPGPLGDGAELVTSNRLVRRVAVRGQIGRTLLLHCSEEYNHLNRILPGLHARFA